MKVSYLLNKSLSLKLALLPLLLLLLVVIGSVLALISQLNFSFFLLVLTDPELHFALWMSLATSILSLLLAIFIAIPSAWVMSQVRLPLQKLIDTFLDLPMVLPPLVTGLSLLLLFNSQGILSQFIPIISQWIFSPLGIIVAQTYIASSIMLRNARGTFSSLDSGYRLAAYNLGLSPLQTLLKIELPMCWKPLLCGAILAWSRVIGEFGATLMLAGATRFKTETLPMAVYLNIASGDFEIAVGASLWLLFIAACLLLVLRTLNRNI
ncbi:ABC transporter permease [Pasteurella multocida]|uniref:ABC transporter permease n=1 Tax=Pasteurella multocida TaxID=747 RepID=UPI0007EC642B|nr:ABC transporter permease [Pasteurella multocida]MCL7839639.1 ABC transporter permease [Pasteurella multocida]OBP34281.1 ABC transporter [Pasteurella multocida subsp. multocida]PNM10330.1 molybdate ABC transporter permease subunit [Pasteurella multocida]URH92965.1 ABC transporter permease [Pasteurella multocida]HDR1196374.1 ABC transporter permease subunit [Pasteurella multocida]